ncbi:MAG: sigma-54-dependent Fis family transcriptional regulator [Deltaproteobacteria bacterium]|nr:sigma-54-dependent Fis family transcriptional regulator [Deltaproteobacteria bacterium]
MDAVRVLVIEDDDQVRQLFNEFLELQGFEVQWASDGREGICLLRKHSFDIVLTDLKLPEFSGLDVIKEIRNLNAPSIGIVITGYGAIDTAVQAMKLGAFDYITKPVELDRLKIILKGAINHLHSQTLSRARHSFPQMKTRRRSASLIGKSKSMKSVFKMIEKIAPTDSTVLIIGESGTGKELVAKSIHSNSDRKNQPFVPVNCGAIPESLLESELFGHEKGAFTGAVKARTGRFEKAHRGTIFLDEVGDMSPLLQTKLLRVLQEREFERIGGTKSIRVDIRIIAATHRNLEEEIQKGNFREDLYYRLNVIPIIIPPLRERKSDIPLLIQHFLQRFNGASSRKIKGISNEALKILVEYHWPGNVRELENLIERFVILADESEISKKDLPEKMLHHAREGTTKKRPSKTEIDLNTTVSQFERELIMQALNKTHWVKNRAAGLLHLKRTTLVEKMKRNNIYNEAASST